MGHPLSPNRERIVTQLVNFKEAENLSQELAKVLS